MKTFTTSLLVNRLLTSVLTSGFLIVAGNVCALTTEPSLYNSNVNVIDNVTAPAGIEYASLTANATEKTVFINWVTSTEQNNSHFEVERSSDMKVFKTVAIVLDGFATEGTGKSYKFKEDAGEVAKGKVVYYRLKQIDTDNQVHYSKVIAVQLNTDINIIPKQDAVYHELRSTYNYTSGIADVQNAYISNQTLLSKQATINTGVINNVPVEA